MKLGPQTSLTSLATDELPARTRLYGRDDVRPAVSRATPRRYQFDRGVTVRRWRKMTWTILLFTALMAAWAIGGAATADNAAQCANDTVLGADTCTQARNAGTGIAVVLIFMLWFIGFIVLSLIWFMTRPKGRCARRAARTLSAAAPPAVAAGTTSPRPPRPALRVCPRAERARRVARWRRWNGPREAHG